MRLNNIRVVIARDGGRAVSPLCQGWSPSNGGQTSDVTGISTSVVLTLVPDTPPPVKASAEINAEQLREDGLRKLAIIYEWSDRLASGQVPHR